MLFMQVAVHFYSSYTELAGCPQTTATLAPGSTVGDLFRHLAARFAKLAPLRSSTLVAVGLDYQDDSFVLHDGDEVSLFPPVQGG